MASVEASVETSHIELISEEHNMIIYGIIHCDMDLTYSAEQLPSVEDIDKSMPDIMKKVSETTLAKKAIMVYAPIKSLLHKRSV